MKFFLLMVCLLGCFKGWAQEEEIHWLTIPEAEEQYRKQPKPYVFDFYTDWCGWCKHMDKTTYSDPVVVSFKIGRASCRERV